MLANNNDKSALFGQFYFYLHQTSNIKNMRFEMMKLNQLDDVLSLSLSRKEMDFYSKSMHIKNLVG